jgi:hypothetical protein
MIWKTQHRRLEIKQYDPSPSHSQKMRRKRKKEVNSGVPENMLQTRAMDNESIGIHTSRTENKKRAII